MDEQILLNKLAFRGIKPTALRILILQDALVRRGFVIDRFRSKIGYR